MNNWYENVDVSNSLNQGDFILDCSVIIPPDDIDDIQENGADIEDYDVIIMTQSCDLENNKVKLVLVCPFHRFDVFCERNRQFEDYRLKESLRQGNLPGYHLLNSCPDIDHKEYLIVDFKTVFSVSFNLLNNLKLKQNPRIRLQSPYREHLSQAFARFFMRVGLPTGIPRFEKKKK